MVLPSERCRSPKNGTSEDPLSAGMRQLCGAMWHMGYGTVANIHFRDGDLLDEPPFEIIRRARTKENAWPHYDAPSADFIPKHEHFRLVEELKRTGSGTVDIKVVNGLPVDLEIHERA